MLNHPTLDKLEQMKLFGMATGLTEQMADTTYTAMSFEERLQSHFNARFCRSKWSDQWYTVQALSY